MPNHPGASMTHIADSGVNSNRLLKNAHLLRFSHPSSLRRTFKYASLLSISRALHLGIFEQPVENHFFNNLVNYACHFPPTRYNYREIIRGGDHAKQRE